MTQRKHSRHFGLMLLFTVVVFFALLINSTITSLAVFLLVKSGMIYIASEAILNCSLSSGQTKKQK